VVSERGVNPGGELFRLYCQMLGAGRNSCRACLGPLEFEDFYEGRVWVCDDGLLAHEHHVDKEFELALAEI